MEPLDFNEVQHYVNENVATFHERRIRSLRTLRLNRLLSKNPYLARAKNITTAAEMVGGLLDAFLSSSEEQLFGSFLEGLAVFVAQMTSAGHKSVAEGVDLEFINREIHYVVSIKSGTHWGNSSQQNQLEQNLRVARSEGKTTEAPDAYRACAWNLLWENKDQLPGESRLSESSWTELLVSDQRRYGSLYEDYSSDWISCTRT